MKRELREKYRGGEGECSHRLGEVERGGCVLTIGSSSQRAQEGEWGWGKWQCIDLVRQTALKSQRLG